MSGNGDRNAGPSGSILGEDTPDPWADESDGAEGHTEFEFSPPSPQRAKRPPADPPPPVERKQTKSDVEALLDQVIEEVAPPPATDEVEVPDAYATEEEMPKLARPPAPAVDDHLETNRVEIPKTISQRAKVPVGRDSNTEMFDGEAASLQRAIDSSFGKTPAPVRIPEELTPEVRAVSKVLMGRTSDALVPPKAAPAPKAPPYPKAPPPKPAPKPVTSSMRPLTEDLVLNDASTPVPDTRSAVAAAPPPQAPPRPVAPVSSPSGAELDAVADAFDLEPSEPSHPAADLGSGLELAYDPKQRPTARNDTLRPSQAALKSLDEVEPDAMATTTKILIAFGVVLVAIVAVALLR